MYGEGDACSSWRVDDRCCVGLGCVLDSGSGTELALKQLLTLSLARATTQLAAHPLAYDKVSDKRRSRWLPLAGVLLLRNAPGPGRVETTHALAVCHLLESASD